MSSLNHTFATLDERAAFDTIIDARSPSEFAQDHIPGAINCPVLDDRERAVVGTLYKQESPFEARKVGAVLVARNIARHIETLFARQPKGWRPLVYCWRGGQRSGAFTHILREVGWGAKRLQGGYKTWRNHVLQALQTEPGRFRYRVVAGPTGSGKTRVLEALRARGQQVLDLEALAAHKGSVLGGLPGQGQPSQKMFESQILQTLQSLDPARAVYVESESRHVGNLRLPEAVYQGIQDGDWLLVQAALEQRVAFLMQDYAHFLQGDALAVQLERLRELCGAQRVQAWQALASRQQYPALVTELLQHHYDLHYARSMHRHSAGKAPTVFEAQALTPDGFDALALQMVRAFDAP